MRTQRETALVEALAAMESAQDSGQSTGALRSKVEALLGHEAGCCCDACNEDYHPLACECCGGYAKKEAA